MQRKVFYIHIPKTAGSTLNFVLQRVYDSSERLHLNWHWSEWHQPVQLLSEALRQKPRIEFIHGHFLYGLQESVECHCTCVTILRDPVKRVVSGYFHLLRDRRPAIRNRAAGKSLEELLAKKSILDFDNGQVRRISGIGETVSFGEVGPQHLDLAIRNIERDFAFTGLTERFDETLLLLAKILNWPTPYYWRQNTGKNKRPDEISTEIKEQITTLNKFDNLLYQYVADRFEAQLQTHRINVNRFQRLNQLYNMVILPRKAAQKMKFLTKRYRS